MSLLPWKKLDSSSTDDYDENVDHGDNTNIANVTMSSEDEWVMSVDSGWRLRLLAITTLGDYDSLRLRLSAIMTLGDNNTWRLRLSALTRSSGSYTELRRLHRVAARSWSRGAKSNSWRLHVSIYLLSLFAMKSLTTSRACSLLSVELYIPQNRPFGLTKAKAIDFTMLATPIVAYKQYTMN